MAALYYIVIASAILPVMCLLSELCERYNPLFWI